MTQEIFSTGEAADLRSERARRAVKAFRALQPGLTGYARALTGRRDIVVELAQGAPMTDGKKIYFKPPIEMGDLTPHQRAKCDKRDPESLQLFCDACRIRESVLASIYHEIGHNVSGSFAKPTMKAKNEALSRAIAERPGKYSERIKKEWDAIPDWKKDNYMALASVISPFLPVLVNCLEDARVDSEMFRARKGTKVMFDAMYKNIFVNGIERNDGTIFRWSETPLNSQVVIGVFVLACHYNFEGWFHPLVAEALKDEELVSLVSRVDTAKSVEATYSLAFPILARLRELGFCLNPDEEQEPPEEQDDDKDDEQDDQADDESDSDDSDSDESGDDGGSDGNDSDESGSDSGSDDSDEAEEPGGGGAEDNSAPSTDAGEPDNSETTDSGSESTGPLDDEPEDDGQGEFDDGEGAPESGGESDSEPEGGEGTPEGSEGYQTGEGEGEPVEDAADGEERPEPGTSRLGDLEDEEESTVIDSGEDLGEGGTVDDTEPEYGTPEKVLEDVKVFSHHDWESRPVIDKDEAEELDRAIIQSEYFEKPSVNVHGVREHKYGIPIMETDASGRLVDVSTAWTDQYSSYIGYRTGIDVDLTIPETILGPGLIEMRRVFSDNARAAYLKHLKSGKVNSRSLGKRAPFGDPRLFQKKRLPGKRSYAVLLGIDISGSTLGVNLALAKRAAVAQAELCQRMGIDFAVYAHTASGRGNSWGNDLSLDIYEIKAFDAPWDNKAREALGKISADSENLDGHGIEYYRRKIERHSSTDKIILYYSDGKMPAANYDEELEILQREIAYCKSHKITLMGVGIRTDSPKRHGLDTVEVNDDSDISKVLRHLQSGILLHR
jgi:hypothetical protein